ncbi:MAG: AIR carboxylase family protein [Spirochaetia bacterium]|nr:AIR carboxylase family protein [Spirochaetia bacterium]
MKQLLFIVGSESDREQIAPALQLADEKGLTYDFKVYSAHRNLEELKDFLAEHENDYRVIITAAGLSAALPGVVAALVKKPVIGIPLVAGALSGIDALLSILQLPKGIPCATMGIGKQGALNAVHLAERMLNC